jgi:hypothetical protein
MYDYDTDTATRDGVIISAPEKEKPESQKQETPEERRRRMEREVLFGDW